MRTETIILSIHPSHIEKILSGEKRYEYRKRIPTDIRHIVVYATAPIKMIVALIEIDSILKGTPESVWKKTKKHAGVSKDFSCSILPTIKILMLSNLRRFSN